MDENCSIQLNDISMDSIEIKKEISNYDYIPDDQMASIEIKKVISKYDYIPDDEMESIELRKEISNKGYISDDEAQSNRVIVINGKAGGRATPNGSKIIECSVCFKLLKESSIRQHMKTHIGLKPYQCSICNVRFTRKGDVSRHATAVHGTHSPTFKCETCNKWFSDAGLYSVHLKSHVKQPYFNCDSCYSKFCKKEYYDNHVKYGNCYAKLDNLEITNIYDSEFLQSSSHEEQPNYSQRLDMQSTASSSKKVVNILKHGNSSSLDNSCNNENIDSNSIYKMNLTPQNINSSAAAYNECEYVSNAIKTAVCQSEDIIKSIQQTIGSNMTILQNKSKSPHLRSTKTSSELHIKAVINDTLQSFSIRLPLGMTFDATTPVGMRAILNIISNVCSEKGKVDGDIDVKVVRSMR